jgi:hypothetical protein
MKSHSVFSRPILAFIVILALTSQACAITLFEWPFATPGAPATGLPGGPTPTPMPRSGTTCDCPKRRWWGWRSVSSTR